MANTKLTKRDYFNIIRNAYPTDADNYDAVIGFIDHELELLAKKNAGDKKPTATQVANEGIKTDILEVLTSNGDMMTVTDIQKLMGVDLSNQKISALLRQMIADGSVVKIEDKRKSYFKVVTAE